MWNRFMVLTVCRYCASLLLLVLTADEAVSAQAVPERTDTLKERPQIGYSQAYAILEPYTGPVVKGVDTTTLTGKVMCGYQGWFGAPGDGSLASGWRHWTARQGPFADGNAKVDLWPDM